MKAIERVPRMRLGQAAVIVSFGLFIAGSAAADWQGTKWGMTPAEVERATNGAAAIGTGSPGQAVEGFVTGNTGIYKAGGIAYDAAFYFKGGGLRMVKLTPPRDSCGIIEDRLTSIYGKPFSKTKVSILYASTWHDAATNSDVRFVSTGGYCSIDYEPYLHDRKDSGL